jgi:hypothetical protein
MSISRGTVLSGGDELFDRQGRLPGDALDVIGRPVVTALAVPASAAEGGAQARRSMMTSSAASSPRSSPTGCG